MNIVEVRDLSTLVDMKEWRSESHAQPPCQVAVLHDSCDVGLCDSVYENDEGIRS